MNRIIYCCACEQDVQAALTDGKEIYPHREDLYKLPFWVCHYCGNYVGCHYKTENKIKPLGCIPTKQIKLLRKEIHALLDPLWNGDKMLRKRLYKLLSGILGREYHTADIRTTREANQIIEFLKKKVKNEI